MTSGSIPLTHFSLFSGIGGLDLAAEWAGFRTIGQVEYANYPFRVLRRQFGRLPRWRDIRDVTGEAIIERCGVPTIISGGFPCQPHSLAGKRLASCDERDLWGELARVVREVRPRWVVGENVAGLRSSESGRFFGRVLRDLAEMGYTVGWGSWEAADAGAPHHRERVFIVAHSRDARYDHSPEREPITDGAADHEVGRDERARSRRRGAHVADPSCELRHWSRRARHGRAELTDRRGDASDTDGHGCEGAHLHLRSRGSRETTSHARRSCPTVSNPDGERFQERDPSSCSRETRLRAWCSDPRGDLWLAEPPVGRVADGIPSWVDRLKCLGNAVVPQQAYPIFAAIAEVEKMVEE